MSGNLLAQAAPPAPSPVQVSKSASSSSVLLSVSLASGAQMKQHSDPSDRLKQLAKLAEPDERRAQPDESECNQMGQQQQQQQPQPAAQLAKLDSAQEAALVEDGDGATGSSLLHVARDPQIQTPKPRITELKRLLRHTNSLNQVPEFGIETEHEQELSLLMDQIDVWGLNVFEVHRCSEQHSLTVVMFKIFKVSFLAPQLVGFTLPRDVS